MLSGVSKMVPGVSAVVLGAVSDAVLRGMPSTLYGEVLDMVSGIMLSAVLSGVSGVVVDVVSALITRSVQSPHLRQGADLREGGSAHQGTWVSAAQ